MYMVRFRARVTCTCRLTVVDKTVLRSQALLACFW